MNSVRGAKVIVRRDAICPGGGIEDSRIHTGRRIIAGDVRNSKPAAGGAIQCRNAESSRLRADSILVRGGIAGCDVKANIAIVDRIGRKRG